MDAETSLYLENIEEYVLDESRVVTYKWLSQTLEIHVNLAKRLLETFLKEQKKKKESDATPLSVTYAVTGTQETKNGTKMTRVAIVNESALENAKSSMKEVLGQHVFSIQKSTLKDNSALFSTDYEITKQNITQSNRFSAIQCEEAQVRSTEDADRLRESGRPVAPTEKPKVNGFGNHASSTSSKSAKTSSSTSSAPKAKKGSIAASFAVGASKSKTQDPKKEDDKKKESPEKKEEEKKKEEVKKPKPKGMMAFMSQKKTEKSAPSSSGDAKEKTDSKPIKIEMEEEEEEEEEVDVEVKEEEKPKGSKVKATRSTQRTTKNKKRVDVSDSDSDDGRHRTVAKKRRRIIQHDSSSSSSSEEEDEQDMDDSPIPPTPPPVAEPIQSDEEEEAPPPPKDQSQERTDTQGSGRRRIRKRVLKSKVSVDEDGCMVTEKVWENESTDASEDEAPPPKPKPPQKKEERDSDDEDEKTDKKKKKTKTPPSTGGKQSSLMSFFKKK